MNWAFASFSEFLAMGKYAAYVWPCIGLTVVLLFGLLLSERREYRKLAAAMQRQGLSMSKASKTK